MKKFFIVWCIVIALSILMGVIASASAEVYPRAFIISELDKDNDMIFLEDACGNVWLATGIEDYCVGDIVVAVMDDNKTDTSIYDDIIVSMCYSGWSEGWD